jgi:long-chain acyl-CoA synthetase
MSILLKMDRGQLGEEFCRQRVRRAFVGFAPLPLKLKAGFEAKYGVRMIENYGLSETLFVTARSAAVAGTGYVGEVLPGIELRVVGEDGSPLPPGVEGEIQILTPDLMAGYLDEKGRPATLAVWMTPARFSSPGARRTSLFAEEST